MYNCRHSGVWCPKPVSRAVLKKRGWKLRSKGHAWGLAWSHWLTETPTKSQCLTFLFTCDVAQVYATWNWSGTTSWISEIKMLFVWLGQIVNGSFNCVSLWFNTTGSPLFTKWGWKIALSAILMWKSTEIQVRNWNDWYSKIYFKGQTRSNIEIKKNALRGKFLMFCSYYLY